MEHSQNSPVTDKKLDWSYFYRVDKVRENVSYDFDNDFERKFAACNNIGERFETLVYCILTEIQSLFSAKSYWLQTQKTHDGKKDFVQFNGTNEVISWAECKNYHKTLSINVVSPTLIMSIIEGIPAVYIFSLNKLNGTFEKYINDFQIASGKKIYIYADDFLENLLIACGSDEKLGFLKKFIPDLQFNAAHKTGASIISEVRIEDLFRNEILPKGISDDRAARGLVNRNELIKVICKLYNASLTDIEARIDIVSDTSNMELFVPRLISDFKIKRGEIKTLSFYCKAISLKDSIAELPDIALIAEETCSYILKGTEIACSLSNYVPLLQFSLQIKKKIIDEIESKNYLIEGRGGTGKSRLLKEIYSSLNENESGESWNIIIIDVEKNSDYSFLIRTLLTQSIGIKDFDFNIESESIDEKYDDNVKLILKIINSETDLNPLYASIIKLCNKIIEDKKYVVLIDNIQSAPKLFLEVVKSLKCQKILTCNLDFIDSPKNLEDLKKTFEVVRLKYKKGRAFQQEYFYNALYPIDGSAVEDLLIDVKWTPLSLYHYVNALLEQRIVGYIDNRFQIIDSQSLYELKKVYIADIAADATVPPLEVKSIGVRIQYILERYRDTPLLSQINNVMLLVSLWGQCERIEEFKSALKILNERNILEPAREGYVFTHQLISYVFLKNANPYIWTELLSFSKSDSITKVIAANFSAFDNLDMKNLSDALKEKKYFELTVKGLGLFYDSVVKNTERFIEVSDVEDIRNLFDYIEYYIFRIRDTLGHGTGLGEHETAFEIIVLLSDKLIGRGVDMQLYRISWEYLNRLLTEHHYEKAIYASEKLIGILKKARKNDFIYFWLAMSYNRKSVALASIEDISNRANSRIVSLCFEKSKEYAEKDSERRAVSAVLIDMGYRFFNNCDNYDAQKAIVYFEAAKIERVESFYSQDLYHDILILILKNQYADAYKLINESLDGNREITYFYKGKILMSKVVVQMCLCEKNEKEEKRRIDLSIKTLENFIYAHGFYRWNFYLYFLKAKTDLMFGTGSPSSIRNNCIKSLNEYYKTTADENARKMHRPFYYAVLKIMQDAHCLNLLKINSNDSVLKSILAGISDARELFANCPQGIIFDKNKGETYPSL